jgi:hypothetical protein
VWFLRSSNINSNTGTNNIAIPNNDDGTDYTTL